MCKGFYIYFLQYDRLLKYIPGDEVAGMSSGSRITVRLSDGIKPNSWSAGVLKVNGAERSLVVQLMSPVNGIVGMATVTIDTEIIEKNINSAAVSSNATVSTVSSTSTKDNDAEEDEEEENEEEEEEHEKEEEEEEDEKEEEHEEDSEDVPKKHLIVRYVHAQPVYFLFNPWNKGEP